MLNGRWFRLLGGHQAGKSTTFLNLKQHLDGSGKYTCLYVDLADLGDVSPVGDLLLPASEMETQLARLVGEAVAIEGKRAASLPQQQTSILESTPMLRTLAS